MELVLPAFGEVSYKTDAENRHSNVTVIFDAEDDLFDKYVDLLQNEGYIAKQRYERECRHRFAAFYKDGYGVYLNDFRGTGELYIATEQNDRYFDNADHPLDAKVEPQLTTVKIEDYGMSYAVRLSDGRFIVFDGGREFESDSIHLFHTLKEGSPYETPVIAMWVLTHPHSDHFHAFLTFTEMFGDQVVVEKVLYNFPEKDDLAHFPYLNYRDPRIQRNSSPEYNMPLMFEAAQKLGATLIEAHTGQIFNISDAVCEVLVSPDDTYHRDTKNINALSIVIRMTLAGQVILWAADAPFSDSNICEKYGDFLKSDILQIPHHGFQSGTYEAEIAGYKLIRPSVCFLPVIDYNAFTCFCAYREGTDYIMTQAGIDEMITGETARTVTLPYTASPLGKKELERRYLDGKDDGGAKTWIFSDLSTGCKEDPEFTILNTVNRQAVIYADIFFEDISQNLRFIKIVVPNERIRKVCIFNAEQVDGDAMEFNWLALAAKGIPENATFSVRFKSDIPVVITNKNHKESFHSQNRR